MGFFTERADGAGGLYTDMALERRRADTHVDGVEYRVREGNSGTWESVKIKTDAGERSIGRPIGTYDTLDTGPMQTLDYDEIDDAKEDIAKELCELFDAMGIIPERLLIVGLGNENLTPDSVGPKTARLVKPTMQIKNFDEEMFFALECSEIAVLSPGVCMESGLDAAVIVRSVARKILPDAVIAIDALATSSEERLGSTIQISTTGLFPGGGVGNLREGINEDSVGVPVIAIGVPTVIDARAFSEGYRARRKYGGLLVAPKEIDEITDVAAQIIAGGINQAFGICDI